MNFSDEARAYHEEHFNCAQAVFLPFAKKFGIDQNLALKLATPFGGGMGRNGQVCGAVSGGLMAIGYLHGYAVYDPEQKEACYAFAKAFQEKFIELHGDLTCPGLLGLDISNPEELAEAREEDLFHILCPVFIADAARIVGEMSALPE